MKSKATLTMVNSQYGELVLHNDDIVIGHTDDGYPIHETDTIVRADNNVPQFFTIADAKEVCGDDCDLTIKWDYARWLLSDDIRNNDIADIQIILVVPIRKVSAQWGGTLTERADEQSNADLVPNEVSRFVDELPAESVQSVTVTQKMIEDNDVPF